MPPLAIYAAAALALLVSGFGAGWKVESWRWSASLVAIEHAAEAERQAEAEKQAAASAALEQQKEQTRVVYKTITKTVDRIVEKPVYRDRACLDDDGVRAVNAALAGKAPDPGQSHPAVPAAKPAR
jgi:hypothetical protein